MFPNTLSPSKHCKVCNKKYFKKINVSKKNWARSNYCSKFCQRVVLNTGVPWNKGIKVDRTKFPTMGHFQKHTKESLELITKKNKENAKKLGNDFYRDIQKLAIKVGKKNHSFKGTLGKTKELSANWLGNDASYSSKHKWIQKYWTKIGICQNCGEQPKVFGNRKWGTEWSNKTGNYDREDINDWQELCKPCHLLYDR